MHLIAKITSISKIALGTIGCLISLNLFSQEDLPTVVPPSPETSALFKYQDYPMDYSTGLPQITIPLFEVKSGELSVPISMSYHASGCRVGDADGPIAKSWSLHAGGAVSRSIHGWPDLEVAPCGVKSFPFPNPFVTNNINPNTNESDLAYVEAIMQYAGNPDLVGASDYTDSEYDIFSYTIGNRSGKLIFKDENGTKVPKLIPPAPIQVNADTNDCGLIDFNFVDEKGVSYHFIPSESNVYGTVRGTTAYALSQIISADKTDTIEYSYLGDSQRRYSTSQFITLGDGYAPDTNSGNIFDNGGHPLFQENTEAVTSFDTYNTSKISEIRFKNGRATFSLIANPDDQDALVIDNIEIYSKDSLLKTINFHRSTLHEWPSEQRATHKLDSLTIHDSSGHTVEKYGFEHYPTPYGDSSSTETTLNFRYVDWWGYYNASGDWDMVPEHTNVGVLPATTTYDLGNPNAQRDPNLSALKSGVLKKITYPTGGTTEFAYENNKYMSVSTNQVKDGPGLRVSQIINTDNLGNTLYATFEYGDSGYGFIDLEPLPHYMKNEDVYVAFTNNDAFNINHVYRKRTFYSGFSPTLGETASRPIVYTKVTKYWGTKADHAGKTEFEYDRIPWGARAIGPSKWDIPEYNYWNVSKLKKQIDYKLTIDNGSYIYDKRKEIVNIYNTVKLEDVLALHVQRRMYATGGRVSLTGLYPESHIAAGGMMNDGGFGRTMYVYGEYNIPIGTKHLSSTTETLYNDDGTTVANQSTFEYNSYQLTSHITKETSQGNGMEYEKYITYPFDYPATGVLGQMVDINMVGYPVDENEFRNEGTPVKSIKTDYFDWGGIDPMIKPILVEARKGDKPMESLIEYKDYTPEGNIKEVSKVDGPPISYVWGYGGEHPIAKLENFGSSQITGTIQGLMDAAESASNLDNDRTRDHTGNEGALRQALDDLRDSLPEGAMMTSYTYDPLIGITSITDSRGQTTYYDYDAFGRLEEVRDLNGQLIQDTRYHYAGENN